MVKNKEMIWVKNWNDMHRCRSQKFGENLTSVYQDMGLMGHNGEDYILLRGEDIYASHDGFVSKISNDEKAGVGVYLMSNDLSYRTVYWHLKKDSVVVTEGQAVKAGDKLGQGDNTGLSTGDHLHWGLKLYDKGLLLNEMNGYWGSVDPDPFKQTMRLIRKLGTPEVWLIAENKRFWVLDPDTLNRGTSIWGGWSGIAEGDPYQYVYGGIIFIANPDDPIL